MVVVLYLQRGEYLISEIMMDAVQRARHMLHFQDVRVDTEDIEIAVQANPEILDLFSRSEFRFSPRHPVEVYRIQSFCSNPNKFYNLRTTPLYLK